jgi:hypothetical protein
VAGEVAVHLIGTVRLVVPEAEAVVLVLLILLEALER